MEKLPKVILLAVLSVAAFGVFLVVLTPVSKEQGKPELKALPVAKANVPNEATVSAPDGTFTLTLKEEKGKENTTYSFKITDSKDGSWKEIFTKTVLPGTTMEIPRNTFSPDGKYVFLKEKGPDRTLYIVLTTSGEAITNDSQNLEIAGSFAEKYPDYTISEATGWGGVGLIVFKTTKKDGGEGPSFWFEVPSGAFIQLSS